MKILNILWKFVKYLKEQRLGKKLAIFGDGGTYHNSEEFRELLKLINQEKPEEKWLINFMHLLRNAPEQNPLGRYLVSNQNFYCLILSSL